MILLRRLSIVTLVAGGLVGGAYWLLPVLASRGVAAPSPTEPSRHQWELERLHTTWGPESYSRAVIDLMVVDFFQGRRGGVFVDVGAYDYRLYSNTYLLEAQFDWSGVAIDALDEFRAGYEQHRPRTRFHTFYVSDTDDADVDFFVVDGYLSQSTGVRANADRKESGYSTIEVPQITLDRLLELEGLEAIDFLTMDIELAEPQALRGFDIDRFQPQLVCIEMHAPVAQELRRYFGEHGYVELEMWSQLDVRNSFFARGDLASATLERLDRDLAAFVATRSADS